MESLKFERGINGFIDYMPIIETIKNSIVSQINLLMVMHGEAIDFSTDSCKPVLTTSEGECEIFEILKYSDGSDIPCVKTSLNDMCENWQLTELNLDDLEALYNSVFNFVMKKHFKTI